MDLHDQMDVGDVVRSIFTTCDINNTDLVPVSKLIEFIRPYLVEDLKALENLQHLLDPFNTEALVSSERFCQVMNNWCEKLTSSTSSEEQNSDTEFNKTPGNPTGIHSNDLPYTHSTPRASIGDKLLKCKDLLNLSNASGYSLSTSQVEQCEPDKTILEEEIKTLKRQLAKTSNELVMIKQQLTASEDMNEQLQQDLGKMNRILQEEQQVNEHLNKDIKYSEDLRDELAYCRKNIGQLKSKLEQSERDNMYSQKLANQLEQEKSKFEKKAETASKYLEQFLKQLNTARDEIESQGAQMNQLTKVFNELKQKFSQQEDLVDQLIEENNTLNQQKQTLEKTLKSKISSPAICNFDNLEKQDTSEESFNNENQQVIIKTNGDIVDKTSKSLYAEICKTRSLLDVSYSPVLLETDEVEMIKRSLLEADNLRSTLRGVEEELNKAKNALGMKSDESLVLEKELVEVKSRLTESQTLNRKYHETLGTMLHDLNQSLSVTVEHTSLQAEITELQNDLESNDSKFTFKGLALIKKQSSLWKSVNAKLVDQNARLQEEVTRAQLELDQQKQNLDISVLKPSNRVETPDGGKGKSYSKQQIVINKLKEKNEHLESLLKNVTKEEPASIQTKVDSLKMIENKIAEKQIICEELDVHYRQLTEDVRKADEELKITQTELNSLKQRLEETETDFQRSKEAGAGADDISEKRTINKFTLSGGSEDANYLLLNGDVCDLNELRLPVKPVYSSNFDAVLDVPTLDVKVFADDLIEQLNWIESSPRSREKMGREELEKMVTALTLLLIAQASTTTQRIEKETEKYRSQYERLLNLITDISHRLRDHVCIGTAEPIIPVHILLEEVKQHIKMLVQSSGQVSVLISEHRIKWCWDLMINYMAMLQKDNEALRDVSRLTSSSSQTDITKSLNAPKSQLDSQPVGKRKPKRSCFGSSVKSIGLFIATVLALMVLIITINLTCRVVATDSQYCPFDGAVKRINIGLPPI